MTGKIWLYIGLLVLLLALTGGGLWFLFNPSPVIEVPEGEPVITMRNSFSRIVAGPVFLRVYMDGTVIYTKETGSLNAIRIWNTGKINEDELNGLLPLFTTGDFESLYRRYEFTGELEKVGNMSCTISIKYLDLDKAVTADWFPSPDSGMTCPDMPYPLNEIYKRLKDIAENRTNEVYRETIRIESSQEVVK